MNQAKKGEYAGGTGQIATPTMNLQLLHHFGFRIRQDYYNTSSSSAKFNISFDEPKQQLTRGDSLCVEM
jgi:hypothetical protein